MKYIDSFLNKITMYRFVLYYTLFLFIVAVVFGAFHILPYSPLALIFSALLIACVCVNANWIFAKVFEVHVNVESVYITALILTLIITPIKSLTDVSFYELAVWASIWAIASKYMFAIGKKHIFNSAAIGVAIPAIFLGVSASWWIGTAVMAPFVLVGGLLMVRKIRRSDLVWAFFAAALVVIIGVHVLGGQNPFVTLNKVLLEAPILFFAFVMLTEPLTTPPTKRLRVSYGIIAGILFAPFIHIGSVYSTPELALLAANVFSYIVSPKGKYMLALREKVKVANDTYDFWFERIGGASKYQPYFKAGQYMEWTLAHTGAEAVKTDMRGNRRYFTLASSPTEKGLAMGVKMYEPSSSFKKALMSLNPGDTIVAGQLAGDFTLPHDVSKKVAFIAGGIGVTPFRSMVKYMIDAGEKRNAILFYSNRTPADIAYKNLFDVAANQIGMKTVYVNASENKMLTAEMIRANAPDFAERMFYISGPHGMVTAFQKILSDMGVPASSIRTDFFPGFA
jgi:ferredoxin-NADP reductase